MSSEYPEDSLSALVDLSFTTPTRRPLPRLRRNPPIAEEDSPPSTPITTRERSPLRRNISNNPQINTMPLSNTDINNLFNTLPEYSPEANLSTFVNSVDNLFLFLQTQNITEVQTYIANCHVLSKVKGEARDFLNLHKKQNWPDVKVALLQKYGDQRTEDILLTQLTTTTQKRNETYNDYFHRITLALNDLLQHVSLHDDPNTAQFKKTFFEQQALRTFCTGLNNPYCDHLSHFNLTSLDEALQKCIAYDNHKQQQQYMSYLKSTMYPKEYSSNKKPNFPPRNNSQNNPNQNFIPKSPPHFQNQRPFGDVNRPLPQRQNPPTNRQVFGTQQNPHRQFPQHSNNPRPMSGVETIRQTNNFPRPMTQTTYNNRTFHHNTEISPNSDENNTNFQIDASEPSTSQ